MVATGCLWARRHHHAVRPAAFGDRCRRGWPTRPRATPVSACRAGRTATSRATRAAMPAGNAQRHRPAPAFLVVGVADGRIDLHRGDQVGVPGVGGEQRLVGEDVDPARQPLRGAGDAAYGGGREDFRAPVAGGAHAEVEVIGDVVAAQRLEAEVLGDPFLAAAACPAGRGSRRVPGWPNNTSCSSLWRLVSRFDSRRISSSVSSGMAWASSISTTT